MVWISSSHSLRSRATATASRLALFSRGVSFCSAPQPQIPFFLNPAHKVKDPLAGFDVLLEQLIPLLPDPDDFFVILSRPC